MPPFDRWRIGSDYVLDREHQALQVWVEASRFEFESFVCKDDPSRGPPKPPREKVPRRPLQGGKGEDAEVEPVGISPKIVKKSSRRDTADEFVPLPREKPSELQQRLADKEKQFLDAEGPLDMLHRQALWPEMAALHTALGHPGDAAVCWANSLWETEDPSGAWSRTWAKAEARLAQWPLSAADFDRLLGLADPTVPDMRAMVACVVSAAADGGEARNKPWSNDCRGYGSSWKSTKTSSASGRSGSPGSAWPGSRLETFWVWHGCATAYWNGCLRAA